MPELPEVETVVRALRQPLVGRTFTEVRNYWPRHIVTPSLAEMQERVHGRTVLSITRRAKYLVFNLSGGETLIIHLKMSGHLAVVDSDTPPDKYAHTIFKLDNEQELRFRDTRKFGRVYLVHDPSDILGHLGPEPLSDSFTVAVLQERLQGRKRVLKPLLLDQTFVAGIGNIYADEALYYARLHPERHSDSLSLTEIEALHRAIQKVLQLGIEREGASIAMYVKPDGSKGDMQNAVAVFRRTGDPCYHCGTPIQRMKLGGRSTHFCPTCQS
ncbi:MAG: bifunctional DNA-formamidopyrimidine glycosylase/DNA-(apurinic or apyrimidinic site) lyase [Ardenticatenaceae bacterium]|nr:bifunctional DNA-formamidopyrimidine glycosylase/DNA-(apurinic or apyrimidinic site) lyase [Ardenticatenaceae bacterium]